MPLCSNYTYQRRNKLSGHTTRRKRVTSSNDKLTVIDLTVTDPIANLTVTNLTATNQTITNESAIPLAAGTTLDGIGFALPISSPVVGAVGALVTKHLQPFEWESTFTAEVVSVVDSGGAAGGKASPILLTLPTMFYFMMGSYLEITVASVDAGIEADADVLFGVGTVVAVDSTLASAEIDHNVLNTITLSGGAGTGTTESAVVLAQFDNLADAIGDIYLNIGVADADISATADITFSGVFRMFGFEVAS